MTARVERLEAPSPSLLTLATMRVLTAASTAFSRWWNRPATLSMSEDWIVDYSRDAAKRAGDC
jgi:hypothetical protein